MDQNGSKNRRTRDEYILLINLTKYNERESHRLQKVRIEFNLLFHEYGEQFNLIRMNINVECFDMLINNAFGPFVWY